MSGQSGVVITIIFKCEFFFFHIRKKYSYIIEYKYEHAKKKYEQKINLLIQIQI